MGINKKSLIKAVDNAIEKYKNIESKYQERLCACYSEQNNNLSPNIDMFGRLHSPVDAYVFDDKIYNKGEYLPDQRDQLEAMFGLIPNNYKEKYQKVLILEDQKDIFKKALGMVDDDKLRISFSEKSWLNKDVEANVTYVYFKGQIATFLANQIKEEQQNIMKEMENKRRETLSEVKSGEEQEIKGEILDIMIVEDEYASNSYQTVFKKLCLIKLEEGNQISGTLSKKIIDLVPDEEDLDWLKGKKVNFVGNIIKSKKDPLKGYFKGPKKIQLFNENGVEIKKAKISKNKSIKI